MPLLTEDDAAQVVRDFPTLAPEAKQAASEWMKRYKQQQDDLGQPLYPKAHKAEEERETRFRSMFEDLKNIDALAPSLQTLLPYSQNPDGDRARVANISYFARLYKQPHERIAKEYPMFVADFAAKKKLGGKQPDDMAVYGLIKADVEKVKLHEDAITGARKAARAAALDIEGGPGITAALSAFADFQKSDADMPAGAESAFWAEYRAAAGIMQKNKKTLLNLADAVERRMKGAEQDGDAEAIAAGKTALIDMTEKELSFALASLRQVMEKRGEATAEQKGKGSWRQAWQMLESIAPVTEGGRSFRQQAGEAAGRTAEGGAYGLANEAQGMWLPYVPETGEVRFTGGQIKTKEDAQAFVQEHLLHIIRDTTTDALNPPQKDGAAITLDAEATALIQEAKERLARSNRISRQIRDFGAQVDPTPNIFASTIGISGAALGITALTRGAALPAMAQIYTGLEFEDLSRKYPDMSARDRVMIANISGGIQAALDKVGVQWFKKAPALRELLVKPMTGQLAKRAAMQGTASYIAENLVEAGQDIATPALMLALKSDVPGFDWDAEWKEFYKGRADVALGMLPLTLIGLGMGSLKDYKGAQDALEMNRELGKLGVIETDRVAVSEKLQAGDIEGAEAVLKDAMGRRMPEVAAEFQNEAEARGIEKQRAYDTAVRLGMAPQILRTEAGYTVQTADGTQAQFATWDEARAVATGGLDEYEAANVDAVARMADHFVSTTPDSLKGGESIEIKPGQQTTLADRVAAGELTVEEAAEAAVVAGTLQGMTREDAAKATFHILGSNALEQKENVRRSVSQVLGGGNVLTAVEEPVEGRWKAGLASGLYTHQGGIAWVRIAEQATGEKFLPTEGEISPLQLTEAISSIVVADVFGRRKDGSRLAPGAVTQGVKAATAQAADARGLAAFLRAFRAFFGQVLRTARKLAKARKDGKLTPEFEAMMDELLGLDTQERYERQVQSEALAMADEFIDDSQFDGQEGWSPEKPGPNGETFSLATRRFLPSEYPDSLAKTITSTRVSSLTSHPRYQEAKKGGYGEAAHAVVVDVLKDERVEDIRAIIAGRDVTFVPVMHLDTGKRANALPMAYADELQSRLGGEVAEDIVKDQGAANTGASVQDRFANEQRFVGPVTPGGLYLVVDDNHTSGDTLAALIDHIHAGGGEVIAATALAHSQSQNYLKARPGDIAKLLDKVGLDEASFEREFGYPVSAFTGSEAYRLANLDRGQGVEWLRSRIPSVRSSQNPLGSPSSASEAAGQEGVTYSLRALRPGEKIEEALSSRLKAPEQRIGFFSKARDQVARRLVDSMTWRGDVVEGLDSLADRDASIASLERERKFRLRSRQRELVDQGMDELGPEIRLAYEQDIQRLEDHPLISTMLHDHGKIISRSAAEKAGRKMEGEYDGAPWLPPSWWSGSASKGLLPDVMADNLHFRSVDEMWEALRGVINGTRAMNDQVRQARAAVRSVEKHALQKATDEANRWYADAVNKIPTPHERMMAGFRMLDAILSAFPPEVRGKVGGYTKMASLKSDKARLKHLLQKIEKLDAVLERHLQDEIRKELAKLFKKAESTGSGGEKAGGKIGVDGHRLFAAIGKMVDASPDDVTRDIEKLNSDIEAETSLGKIGEMLERQRLLELFGGLNAKVDGQWVKSAAELEQAWEFAVDVYIRGRDAWGAQLEARLKEIQDLREMHIEAMGGPGTDERLSKTRKKAKAMDGTGLGLLSFVQVLERLYAPGHALVKRWYSAARKATAATTDAIRAAQHRFQDVLKEAMPEASSLERQRAVHALKTEQTVIAPKVEGVTIKKQDIPLDVAAKIVAGEAKPEAFGLEAYHIEELATALEENEAAGKNKRESVTVNVIESRGMESNVPMTEMQAVHVTMLWAQAMYRPALEKHGWTAETLESIESQLSPLALKIRGFLAAEYEAGYEPMNRVYQRMYGIDLPKVANYAPGTFMHEGQDVETDPFGRGLVSAGGVRASFVKQRKNHLARPRWDQDALSLYFSHVGAVNHWMHFAELSREMRQVLLHSESKLATEAQHRSAMQEQVGKWVEILERGGLESARDRNAWDRFARRLSSNLSITALAYNAGTLAKQIPASMAAVMRMPVAAFGRGFMRFVSGRIPVKDIWNQEFIQRRIEGGYSPEARLALAQLWEAPPSRYREALMWGMEQIGMVDGIFTTATAAITYDYHYNQAIKAGLTPDQARAMALEAAEDTVARVAQPVEVIDRSTFEIGAGAGGKLLFMFASDARQKWALLQESVINRHKDPAALRRVLMFHLMSGLAIQTIAAAWRDARDDDDDDVFDPKNWNPLDMVGGIVLQPVSGIPYIGGLANSFARRGEAADAFFAAKDIASGEGDVKDVMTTLHGLSLIASGFGWKQAEALTALAVSAKVARDVTGVVQNVEGED